MECWCLSNQPSMANALHKYYTFSYDEEFDVFTIVTPYDD